MYTKSLINLQRALAVVILAAFLACSQNATSGDSGSGQAPPEKQVEKSTPEAKSSQTASPAKESQKETKKKASDKLRAKIETNHGDIVIKFYPEDAPKTVDNFVKLAESGFYDGLIFHRIIDGFMIQGGDPQGTGGGGPGWSVPAEFNKNKHVDGTVAMARSNHPDSAGSQFYICVAPQPGLDGKYTVFGQTVEGLDVVHAIGKVRTARGDRPVEDVVMKKVTIFEAE